jgi:SAM-dependent methyltransferase
VSASCRVCGARPLAPHLRVAGEAGEAGLIPTTDRFGTALADIGRCAVCGHMQLLSFPAEESLAEAYGEAASPDYVEEEAGQRQTAVCVLERIERHQRPGRLLDLGCWVGFLLAEARDRGWQVQGVEPSTFAASWAREHLDVDVVEDGLLEAELPAGGYDAVVMADVIEHLLDPGAALDRCHELLGEGGVLTLVLPDAGSALARAMGPRWWSVIPTHVHYFTRASLQRLLRTHGFDPLETASSPKAFTVRYYLERIGGYSPALSRGLVAMAERGGLAERIWAPDFGDRMIVLARRRG